MKCKDCVFCYGSDSQGWKRCTVLSQVLYDSKTNPEYLSQHFRLVGGGIVHAEASKQLANKGVPYSVAIVNKLNDDCANEPKRIETLMKQLDGYEVIKKNQ